MKKILFLFLLTFSLPQLSHANYGISSDDNEIVYITASGNKYHKAGCSYLRKSSIEKKLSEVKDSYSPCSRCFGKSNEQPGERIRSSSESTSSGATIYTGPRGGRYHYSKSGKKVYERK